MTRHTRVQAVLIHENKILFLKQFNYKRNEEYWMLPGGGLEEDETALPAIIRELNEECNLQINAMQLIDDREGNGIDVYKQYKTFAKQFNEEPLLVLGSETEAHRKIIGYEWVDLYKEKTWNKLLFSEQIYPSIKQIRGILQNIKLV